MNGFEQLRKGFLAHHCGECTMFAPMRNDITESVALGLCKYGLSTNPFTLINCLATAELISEHKRACPLFEKRKETA